MLFSLQRDSSMKEFLLRKFPDASNNFLSWVIISLVFCLMFSALVSSYIPIVPKKISEVQFWGYEMNKFGFTLSVILGFYFVKNILSYLLFAGSGSIKKWEAFYFTVSRFYFIFSIVLMVFSFVNYFYHLDRTLSFEYFLYGILLLFIIKILYYFFHRNNILPEKWYYKILYICTLQIVPILVLWKVLFF